MSALSEIEKLVNKVAKDALATTDDVNHQSRVETLKVLTPYYLALKKELGHETSNGSTMDDFAQAMKEPDHATQIRGNRGRQQPA
jgi:hypothetical protein